MWSEYSKFPRCLVLPAWFLAIVAFDAGFTVAVISLLGASFFAVLLTYLGKRAAKKREFDSVGSRDSRSPWFSGF